MKKRLIFTALVLAAGAVLLHRFQARRNARALDPKAFVSGIPAIRPDMKLVVATLDMTQSLSAESPKVAWGVDWGTTKAVVSVPARVHYAIDLSGAKPVDFRIDSANGTFTAVFPDPEIQAIEIFFQSKQAVVEPGWGRLQALSGHNLVDRLDRDLYEAVRTAASTEPTLGRIREQARPGLEKLVAAYLVAMGMGKTQVDILFRRELPGAPVSFPTAARHEVIHLSVPGPQLSGKSCGLCPGTVGQRVQKCD